MPKTFEEKIKAAAKKAGLTPADLSGGEGEVGTQSVGGRFKKFLKFLEQIAPIILPILMEEGGEEEDEGK